MSLWPALREELAGRHEVGCQAFAGHREDAHGHLLVVWTPEEYDALPPYSQS